MATCPNWPNLQSGQKTTNVKALQHLLIYHGADIEADGSFGPATKAAVQAFQTSAKLTADGIAGKNTLSKLVVTVKNRTTNQAARAAQTLLAKFESLSVDGDFYTASSVAATNFQEKMGIYEPDSYSEPGYSNVDAITWQYLFGYDAYPSTGGSGVYASVCAVASTLTTAQMNANAEYIYSFLRDQGFTKQAACGVLGNMQAESVINPGIWEVKDNTSYGYGLVQWTPATKFLNRAVSQGTIAAATAAAVDALANNAPKTLMDAELECLIWGCTSGGEFFSPASSMQHSGYSMTFANYKASTLSASILAVVFHDHFERSADGTTGLNKRSTYATNWYNYF